MIRILQRQKSMESARLYISVKSPFIQKDLQKSVNKSGQGLSGQNDLCGLQVETTSLEIGLRLVEVSVLMDWGDGLQALAVKKE